MQDRSWSQFGTNIFFDRALYNVAYLFHLLKIHILRYSANHRIYQIKVYVLIKCCFRILFNLKCPDLLFTSSSKLQYRSFYRVHFWYHAFYIWMFKSSERCNISELVYISGIRVHEFIRQFTSVILKRVKVTHLSHCR